ncbi:kinase-like protein [Nemania sp. FL0916]|nr:kinase-like protein [Nemania sp. FL0916]
MESLKSCIKLLRRKNAMHHSYVPKTLLDSVMTAQAIQDALAESSIPSYRREETLDRIFPNAIRIFAIVLLLDKPDKLTNFIESDQLHDAKLPLTLDVLIRDIHLAEEIAKDFEEKQWELIAPIFRRGTHHLRLSDSSVLPFVQNTLIEKGAFGTVYEVVIDPDHQDPHEGFSERIARKEFDIENDHKKELENLAILNQLKHPNIVELLGSFAHNGKHSLLFPLAKEGNLRDLLATERDSTKFQTLASAVEQVHIFSQSTLNLGLIGCHHDVRPRNILVSDGLFILADFGLSSLKSLSQDSQTPFKNVSDDYLAPECEDWENGFQGGVVHRSADIWSFGCIVAEIATYIALGSEGVKRFREARAYKVRGWTLRQFHQGPKPSKVVESWLSDLEQRKSRIISFLVLVARRALSIDQISRPKADEMAQGLRLIAVYEATSTVSTLFGQVKNKYPSPDIFLEYRRFRAWEHAMGLYDLENRISSDRLSGALQTRLDQESQTQLLDYSILISLVDNLQSFLNRKQMKVIRESFLITIPDECGESTGQIEGNASCTNLSHKIRMQDVISSRSTPYVDQASLHISGELGDHNYGITGEKIIDRMYDRVSRTAELLSRNKFASFRILRCSGFLDDPLRAAFGLIYKFPDSHGERTTSLLEFHTVGWVHQSFNSDNIIFFPEQTSDNASESESSTNKDMRDCTLSLTAIHLVGFNYSRPSTLRVSALESRRSRASLKLYQHPTYLEEGLSFKLEYDYYSLGIVLLEIGFWRSIGDLTLGYKGSYEQKRQQLIAQQVPRLKQHMGREYTAAVRYCLEGSTSQTRSDIEGQGDGLIEDITEERSKELQLEFGRRVVAPLSKYFA